MRKRPSAALVVAFIALFVAAGGSVYAATKISGTQIKKNSIPTNRIKGSFNSGLQKANDGQNKPLLKLGPFRAVGKCAPGSAQVFLRSTVENASSDSDEGSELDNFDFDAGVEQAISYDANETNNQVAFYASSYNEWIAVSPGGKQVYKGSAYSARNLGADCRFLVVAQRIK